MTIESWKNKIFKGSSFNNRMYDDDLKNLAVCYS